MTQQAKLGFSGSLLVAKEGAVIFSKGYGFAHKGKKYPNTPDTVFELASVTKQFTAAGILKLEMQGKLKVEDRISQFFGAAPEDKSEITIHHLLTHSSGLRSDFGGDYDRVSRAAIIEKSLGSKLLSRPGEVYHYSNPGYSLLAAIIEIASGVSYEQYLNENLFKPVGMDQTGNQIPKWKPENVAHGYRYVINLGSPLEQPWDKDGLYWNMRGNSGILSSPNDMFKWSRALEGEAVLSKEAKQKLFTPYISMGPDTTFFYGYGWCIGKTSRGTTVFQHNGSNKIFYADFKRYIDERVVLFIVSNNEQYWADKCVAGLVKVIFGPSAK